MNRQYNIGDVVLHNWTLVRLIGEGSFGKVFEAKRTDFAGEYSAAVKIVVIPQKKEEVREALSSGMTEESASEYFRSFVEELSHEFALMSKLKGDSNIVSYEDHEVIPHTDGIGWDIIIRMELLTPFRDIMMTERLTQEDVVKVGIDICRALELCRKNNIIHRDIKPDNIFRSETGHYKLGDFGIARTIDKTQGGLSKNGTYNYMAPEIYREEPYGFTVDIYSLGIVLYRLLNNNRLPFFPLPPEGYTWQDSQSALARRMSGEKIPYPVEGQGQLAEIVLKACAYDPKDRYATPTEMREALEGLLENTVVKPRHIHRWKEATCTEAKTCTLCGATEGKPLGHREVVDPAVEPTCIEPGRTEGKHCTVCGTILIPQEEIAPLGHTWREATRREPKTCSRCGETEGTPLPSPWKKIFAILAALAVVIGIGIRMVRPKPVPVEPTPTPHIHQWQEATCTEPKSCIECGEIEGEPLGHTEVVDSAVEPTCTESGLTEGKHCSVCDEILIEQKEIAPLGHTWKEATCTEPKTCSECGEAEGEPLWHKEVVDSAVEPTCTKEGVTEGKHCSVCGEVLVEQKKIPALGHDWLEATADTPKTCTRCGITEGEPLEPVVLIPEENKEKCVLASAGWVHTVYLMSDGTVLSTRSDSYGQLSVSDWADITDVSVGMLHVLGLKKDGTVVAAGSNNRGQRDVSDLSDIKQIASGSYHSVFLKSDGTAIARGSNKNGQANITKWQNLIAIAAGWEHTLGLKADGTVLAAGHNGFGQCKVEEWRDIIAITGGGNHTVGLKADGTVVAVGCSTSGQCDVSSWKDIVAISAGENHTVGLRNDGTVVAVGNNTYGQCNTLGWKNIVWVTAGARHTIGIDAEGKVFSAGTNENGQCNVMMNES